MLGPLLRLFEGVHPALVQLGRVPHNYCMKYAVVGFAFVVVLSVVGFFGHRAVVHRQQLRAMTSLCRTYLVNEAELPRPQALKRLAALTVPGSQAILTPDWIAAQDRQGQSTTKVRVIRVKAKLSDVTVKSGHPSMLRAKITLYRQFAPKGHNLVTATGTFWISQKPLRLERAAVNTDQTNSALGPDNFDLNLWNLAPAGPLPHGS